MVNKTAYKEVAVCQNIL